jgi:hypothetical protein
VPSISFPYFDNFLLSHVSVTMQATNVCGTDNIEKYRYGFNTQEKDNEVNGEDSCYTAIPIAIGRQYDARLGRRWNVDPRPNLSISIYTCFSNNPIYNVDIKGDTLKGHNKKSGRRFKRELRKTLKGKGLGKIRRMFKTDSD